MEETLLEAEMIRIHLSQEAQEELESFRRQASSKDSEKALMILMSSEGQSVPQIARILKRNPHTVRDWLKRYRRHGIKGLKRKFSPGRPDKKRRKLMRHIERIISDSPTSHGYQDHVWTVPLIAHDATRKLGITISGDTVIRALKDMNYTYKRPSKTIPATTPSRQEKQMAIRKMLAEIEALSKEEECVIYALDESHFSTEPYLVRGWFKKRWPPQDSDESQKRKSHILWMLESHDKKVLLEKIHEI